MKVVELEDQALNLWVARAEGIEVRYSTAAEFWRIIGEPDEIQWMPHQDWMQGGPIIERERISCHAVDDGWNANMPGGSPYHGPTALIAAMRAFVAARIGDDIPEVGA